MGFGEDAFGRLHHQHGGAARFYRYSEGVRLFKDDGNNHRVHQRLTYVLLSCSDSAPPMRKSFLTLAEEAFKQISPIVKQKWRSLFPGSRREFALEPPGTTLVVRPNL